MILQNAVMGEKTYEKNGKKNVLCQMYCILSIWRESAVKGTGASSTGFVTWNYAVKKLGFVQTGLYTYTLPVVNVIVSAIILHEKSLDLELIWVNPISVFLFPL